MHDTLLHSADAGWHLEHSYAQLPSLFHSEAEPAQAPRPNLTIFNHPLAKSLGLKAEVLDTANAADIFASNRLPDGAKPLAQAYAGHQYGHFTTLGDGRALLLGEQITPDGQRFDIQFKGSGPTEYSRRGDGLAGLGPMLREYIISEAMHALGIPTTRSLAVATTGVTIFRQTRQPGAVLTRVAASHIRVGTFEWAAAHQDKVALKALADYTISRHYPNLTGEKEPYLAFLQAVIERQARLIAQWLHVGFIHGVMNTDNMALSGETIDYGPCAFMNAYDPATVFSSIDHQGRYAYDNQAPIAQWNLARLAETLLPLLHPEDKQAIELANTALESFRSHFDQIWLAGMRKKLGLFNEEAADKALVDDLLETMRLHQADFTNTFRALSTPERTLPIAALKTWHEQWTVRLTRQPQTAVEVTQRMQANNPAFIPRNHKVEEALTAAVEHQDLNIMKRLLTVLATPYDHSVDLPEYSTPETEGAEDYRTYCGT
ncbi:MAG: YdiU family protein [Prosthecobacter sp.]|nr:YdiU family protein [Prosthecobacter sp.]